MAEIIAEWVHPVEGGKVREFGRAVHDDHADGEAGVAPPTFPVVLSADFIDRLVNGILKLDLQRTVHGEQEYEYRRPLRVGEMVRCRARIVGDQVKQGRRGGAMRIVVSEVELLSEPDGEVIGYERSTAIETAPAAGEPA